MVMRNLIWRVGQRVGDGGATAAVLARALFNEGLRQISSGANAMQLARGVRLGVDAAVAQLRQQSRPVSREDELASIAYNITGQRNLSAVLGEMAYLLGAHPNVIIDKLVAPYLERRYIMGAHYKAQIASMLFYTHPQNRRALLVSPALAVVDERLSEADQVIPLLEAALKSDCKAIAIIAQDFSNTALHVLTSNNQLPKDKKKLDILAVKLQTLGEERMLGLTDLAMMTGGTVLSQTSIHNARTAQPSDIGRAQRVEYSETGLVVVAPESTRPLLRETIHALRAQLAEMTLNDEDRPKLVRRLSTLTGGVGELKIGAYSQSERDLLEEHSSRVIKVLSAAQQFGVVPGGGAAYHHCAAAVRALASTEAAEGDVATGVRLLADVLSAPLRQILCNSKVSSSAVYLNRVAEAGETATFDAVTGEVTDAFQAGVLDVTDVVINVLQTAVSGALMALTTDAIVYHKKPKDSFEP